MSTKLDVFKNLPKVYVIGIESKETNIFLSKRLAFLTLIFVPFTVIYAVLLAIFVFLFKKISV
jgi:hypothetical protein